MATRSSFLATAILMVLVSSFVVTTMASRILLDPGWVPVKDLNDKKIVAIAEFGVKTYNGLHPSHEPLKYVSVDKGEVLAKVGTNYHLYITTSTSLGNEKYQLFVFVDSSGKWDLTSFVKLN
ncbi:Cysteine proteinase inhibitor 5 [Linum perenne]